MSEQPGAPVPDEAAQAAARDQIASQAELNPATSPAGASGEDLGVHAAASGAQADEVDARALLAQIQGLQSQVDQLNRERQAASQPDVVKYTTAIADQLQARADQHPSVHADADQTWMPALETAAAAVNAASAGDVGKVREALDKLRAFFDSHGAKNPTQDYGYLHQLADEAQAAATKAA